MATCSHGGFIDSHSAIHYTYDALDSIHSATVCSGWIFGALPSSGLPTAPPSLGALPPGLLCVAVPPGGKTTSVPESPPDDAVAYLIRVDFENDVDTALLAVFENGHEIASGRLDACGVAIWTFDVIQ